jgi:EAL domain-containing protein (putative c-di-GMP-specific phosphodiesterase class I)
LPSGRACRDAVAFQHAGSSPRQRTVAVNISARQLQRVEIVDEVRAALSSSGLDPSCLTLEITESLMIDDVELAIDRLSALRELGVLIAVDDFGTGYSSLNYIRRLPINILKIDKRFIDTVDGDNKDSELTAASIGMARVLELRSVAEGVERPEQHERLKALGCDSAQGLLLARPMSPGALLELLGGDPGDGLTIALARAAISRPRPVKGIGLGGARGHVARSASVGLRRAAFAAG